MDFEKMAREIAHRMLFGGPLDEWGERYPNRPDWQAHAEAAENMLRAAFAAGREAMRSEAIAATEARFSKSPGYEGDEWRFAASEVADAIRALPGKEG